MMFQLPTFYCLNSCIYTLEVHTRKKNDNVVGSFCQLALMYWPYMYLYSINTHISSSQITIVCWYSLEASGPPDSGTVFIFYVRPIL